MDLSILIPARNEMFLGRTVRGILDHLRGATEVIVVLDGAQPDPDLPQHPRLTVVHLPESIGQRAATNLAARLSSAKYVMKCDAHVMFEEGFDVKMLADMQDDWTMVPTMYNLHAFDWLCPQGHRRYQGPEGPCEHKTLPEDPVCGLPTTMDVVWIAKPSPETTSMRFDKNLKFQYFGEYKRRQKGDLVESMSLLGACWMLTRAKYWELEICDEKHGSWGQQGTEVACKTWLSGGRLIVTKKTWFAHLFRTQPGFGFPYQHAPGAIDHARNYSRELWIEGKWPLAKHPLQWLVDKFSPVPGWEETKGIIYYTDNKAPLKLARRVQHQLESIGLPIVSCSIKPMPHFGDNVHLPGERSALQMFRQILAALERSSAEIVFFCEADVLYHPSHFEFRPPRHDVWYYNTNIWKVNAETGHAFRTADCRQVSGIAVYRELALAHYRARVARVEAEGYTQKMGYEPGTHGRPERVDDSTSETWESELPNADIRHNSNFSPTRWSPEEFRNKKYTEGWQEADEVPGWGRII